MVELSFLERFFKEINEGWRKRKELEREGIKVLREKMRKDKKVGRKKGREWKRQQGRQVKMEGGRKVGGKEGKKQGCDSPGCPPHSKDEKDKKNTSRDQKIVDISWAARADSFPSSINQVVLTADNERSVLTERSLCFKTSTFSSNAKGVSRVLTQSTKWKRVPPHSNI